MKRAAFILLLFAVAGLGAVAAAFALAPSAPTGTWKGTIGATRYYGPAASYRPSAVLVVSSFGVTGTFSGLTGASHDAPTATTSCTIRYRRLRLEGRWTVYMQRGAIQYDRSRGYVKNAPCEFTDGNALRVTSVAGGRLRADFGGWFKDGPAVQFDWNGDSQGTFRGYLSKG